MPQEFNFAHVQKAEKKKRKRRKNRKSKCQMDKYQKRSFSFVKRKTYMATPERMTKKTHTHTKRDISIENVR